MADNIFGIEKEDQSPPFKFREMKYSDIYVKSALPIFLINFTIYILVLCIIQCNKIASSSELIRLKRLAMERDPTKIKENVHNVQMSRCRLMISKTLNFAETHFRWNGLIRTNLLIYQNFTLGLFLNIAKGYNPEDKPILKISYLLSWISLLLVFANAYVFYHVVDKYTKNYKNVDIALLLPVPDKKEVTKDNKVLPKAIHNKSANESALDLNSP